jgi:lysophospholipase L1-like esterase
VSVVKNKLVKAILSSAYFTRVNEFKVMNRFAQPGGIVFIGDSITQRYPLGDFFPSLPVYNRGIDGDTTVGLKKRLDVSVFHLKPKVVVLLIGTNDVQLEHDDPLQTVNNIQDIVSSIKQFDASIHVILLSIYPVNTTGERLVEKLVVGPRNNAHITLMNEHLATLKDVEYVDVYRHLIDEHNQLNMRFSKEGLHLSLNGYTVVTNVIYPIVSRAYQQNL